jgi:hypothetical protein
LALSACLRRASTLLGERDCAADDGSGAPDINSSTTAVIAAISAADRGLRTR